MTAEISQDNGGHQTIEYLIMVSTPLSMKSCQLLNSDFKMA